MVSAGNSCVDVLLDGNWLDTYMPKEEWTLEALCIEDNSTHSVRFEFWNAGTNASDCAYIDCALWMPDKFVVNGIAVPASYLNESYPALFANHGGKYKDTLESLASNGVNTVAECYCAGLVPTNVAEVFLATISMECGSPIIGWEPDLNEGGTKRERVYTVEGRESLTTGSWGPTNANSRFFRVKVTMP